MWRKLIVLVMVGLLGLRVCEAGEIGKRVADGGGTVVPTIFIHGYMGNNASLSNVVLEMSKAKKDDKLSYTYSFTKLGIRANRKVPVVYSGQRMTYVVEDSGRLVRIDMAKRNGNLEDKTDYVNSYSVIHFENHSMSLDEQETYLNKVSEMEAIRMRTNRVNIVGHSMGGLLGAQYMIHASRGETSTEVANLVTIGSPIRGGNFTGVMLLAEIGGSRSYMDLKDGGEVINRYVDDGRERIEGSRVLSIGSNKDWLVSYTSATSLGEIVKKSNFKSYKVDSGHTKYSDGSVGKDIAKKVESQLK